MIPVARRNPATNLCSAAAIAGDDAEEPKSRKLAQGLEVEGFEYLGSAGNHHHDTDSRDRCHGDKTISVTVEVHQEPRLDA
jgi:hypothetical protein